MRLKGQLALKTAFLCTIYFNIVVVLSKKAASSDEEPDYYPRVNPNPNNIEELKVHDINQYFDLFTRFYEIEYRDAVHENESYHTFTDNIKRIIIMNKFTTQAKFGINEFSHLSLEDFTDKYTGYNDTGIDNSNVKHFGYNSTQGTPASLDWRILGISPLVRHQGPCKSSYVFSALANIEAQVSKHYNMLPTLSEQQAYDCEPTGNCKFGGMPHKVMESIMNVGGIEEQMSYVYDPADTRECKANTSLMIVKVTNIVRLRPEYEDSLLALLALYGPLVTTIYVSESVKNYYKGVLQPTDCDKKPNHAVLLVGYGITDDKVPYWIIKNSWGKLWGENGYLRLARGVWACHIGEYVVTAIVEPILKENITTTTTTTPAPTTTTTTIPPAYPPIINASIPVGPIAVTYTTTRSDKITSPDSECDSTDDGSDDDITPKKHVTHPTGAIRTTLLEYVSGEKKHRKENNSPKVATSDTDKTSEEKSDGSDNEDRGPLTGVIEDARLRAMLSDEEDTNEVHLLKTDDDNDQSSEYKVVLTDKRAKEAKEKKALKEEEAEESESENENDAKAEDPPKKSASESESYDSQEAVEPKVTQGFLDIKP